MKTVPPAARPKVKSHLLEEELSAIVFSVWITEVWADRKPDRKRRIMKRSFFIV